MKGNPYLPPLFVDLVNGVSGLFKNRSKKKGVSRKQKKASAPKTVKFFAPKKEKAAKTPMFKPYRWALVGFAVVFAGLGQWQMSKVWDNSTLYYGLVLYAVAVVLFLLAFHRFPDDGLSEAPLAPRMEWTVFGLIMLIAAFFRIYGLDTFPNGIFMDQGFVGWQALKIAHEHTIPSLFAYLYEEPMNASSYLFYLMAPWFCIFSPTQTHLFLFYALLGLSTFPLIYWTFRQIFGARVALLSLYFLAIMRWHFNLNRNGFPTSQVPLYMFGTLAFFLYWLKSRKSWSLWISVAFFTLGLYTYQAYKIFPLLLLLLCFYEFLTRWWLPLTASEKKKGLWDKARFLFFSKKGIEKLFSLLRLPEAKKLGIALVIVAVFVSPMVIYMIHMGKIGSREGENIWAVCKSQHSLKPIKEMIGKTLLMCNRSGDDNERHNLPNYRMLDDFSGPLFFIGAFYAMSRIRQRKFYYAIVGILIMSLPCLLSVVPAHANRMMGVTAFVAFLIATPLAAIWGRVRQLWGTVGEFFFWSVLAIPLYMAAVQNYQIYFHDQVNEGCYWTNSFYGGYSYDASEIGKAIAKYGNEYDYYLYKRHFDHFTVKYLAYPYRDRVHQLEVPGSFAPLDTDGTRGLFFAFQPEQSGFMEMVKSFYPDCQVDVIKDLNGKAVIYFVRVSADSAKKAKGLTLNRGKGESLDVPLFPEGLPPGPYRGVLKGAVYVDQTSDYGFTFQSNAKMTWSLGGHLIGKATTLRLVRGFYPIEIHLSAGAGPVQVQISLVSNLGHTELLDNAHFTHLDLARGLKAEYYDRTNPNIKAPVLEEWDPLVNFSQGNDFPYVNSSETAHWEGELIAPQNGIYHFSAKTDEFAKILIDNQTVVPWGRNPSGNVTLTAGTHAFSADFQKDLGPSLSLMWLPPGAPNQEVIPNSAFGQAH